MGSPKIPSCGGGSDANMNERCNFNGLHNKTKKFSSFECPNFRVPKFSSVQIFESKLEISKWENNFPASLLVYMFSIILRREIDQGMVGEMNL